ncbi:septin-12 isoform X2 [Hyla sarda]|uniref:septin-12 isoform X2 n=1 Tax=Hyla sarda TaxID=327740 RepID=UPI0024C222FF|nr:septin-12 isoform X2 [Hyla sarda]
MAVWARWKRKRKVYDSDQRRFHLRVACTSLKRSFDMEDIDDAPVFSSTSPLASPFSPGQPPVSRTSNGDSQISTGSHQPLYQSRIRISSSCSPSQSPVLKSRITSSLSFNRGTMQMAKANGTAGQGLTRVSSFQTRLHPNSFSSSGQGSDSESLHSSTSSLECPLPTKPFQSLRPTQTSVGSGITISSVTSPVLKKFSSHGNVFHSEIERPGVRLVPVATKNHGSLPSLDLHIAEDPIPDLVPSPDAGYPPSEGWSSPSPDYKRPQSRNAISISREPSFSSSSSSSPPTECTPLNCSLTSSPSPPPVFGPVQPATLQKFPVSLQSSIGRSSVSGPEQLNRPLPRTQLRVNLHSNPGVSSHQTKEKTEVAYKSPPQMSPHPPSGRTPSVNNFTNQVPPISGILMPAPQQEFGQEANHVNNMKSSEIHSSTERLRSMMQRANSFNKADTDILQDRCAREDMVIEKSAGRVADLIKSVQDTVAQEKPSFPSRIQGNGHVTSIPYAHDSLQNQRFSEVSRNGVPPLHHCLRLEPKTKVKPEAPATVSCKEEDVQRESVEEKLKITDSLLEDLSPGPERVSSGRMEEPRLVRAAEDAKMCEDLGREPFGYVGIDSVLDQMKRKAMKYGFEFNIIVVGQSGLGKSTLVNTLFKSKVIRKTPGAGIPKTLEMKAVSQVIEERGMEMRLTVIDTPGFGDQINNQNCWDPIIKYIHEQYEKYLREEILVNRKRRIPDSRIHSCIYFIPPTGHWLRPLDLEFMKRLGRIVNVVPVIAKADTLTLEEREEFKQRIRKDLQTHGISVYPQPELDEDPTEALLNEKIRQKIPFAVVGTDEEHQINGRRILGRKTKWGIIEVENTSHCEFANLRDLLIRSNLQDLKDITHNIHYESYRVSRLNEKMNGTPSQLKEPTSL